MIGLDTNVVLRYVMQDDPDQSAAANELFDGLSEDDPGFISLVALVEVVWVIRRAYRLSRDSAHEVVRRLLSVREVVLDSPDLVNRALRRANQGADFSDAVVIEQSLAAGCQQVVTFDRRAARHAGMTVVGD